MQTGENEQGLRKIGYDQADQHYDFSFALLLLLLCLIPGMAANFRFDRPLNGQYQEHQIIQQLS